MGKNLPSDRDHSLLDPHHQDLKFLPFSKPSTNNAMAAKGSGLLDRFTDRTILLLDKLQEDWRVAGRAQY